MVKRYDAEEPEAESANDILLDHSWDYDSELGNCDVFRYKKESGTTYEIKVPAVYVNPYLD